MRIDSWEGLLQHVFARLAHDVAGRMTALAAIGYIARGHNERAELENVLVTERTRLESTLAALRSFPDATAAPAAYELNTLLTPVAGFARWLRVAADVELHPAETGVAVRAAAGPLQRALLLALASAAREDTTMVVGVQRNGPETVLVVEGGEVPAAALAEVAEWAERACGIARVRPAGVEIVLRSA
ncbi:MAG: hypothetical protein GX539_10140 [Candidatus Cloacimonetes bacterium]|nr:hypothetical protein [Candidatus Cloacimonadota bacterium]